MPPRTPLPRLGVVVGPGSAGASDVFAAGLGLCEPVFVVDRTVTGTMEVPPSLADLICDITGMDPDAAATAVRAAGIDHIITFSERQLIRTAEIAARNGLPCLPVAAARLCRDKVRQRRALAAAGVDTLLAYPVSDSDDLAAAVAATGFPIVIKPRYGMGSVDTIRASGLAEAQDWLSSHAGDGGTEFIVEPLLAGDPNQAGAAWGDYVSVESIVDAETINHVCVTGKFPLVAPFREGGMVIPSTLDPSAEIRARAVAETAIRALGVTHAVTHTELKLTPAGPRVIEVNARLGGYVADILRRASGYDLVHAAVRNALGLPAPVPPPPHIVAYQFFVQPPSGATGIDRIDGAHTVTAIPGVRHLDQRLAPGDRVDSRHGTDGFVAVVHGETAHHDDVITAVAAVMQALKITYR